MDGQRTQNQQLNLQANIPVSSNLQLHVLSLPFSTCSMSTAWIVILHAAAGQSHEKGTR